MFAYYQGLTFGVGFSCFPKRARLRESVYWNYVIAWLIGFGILSGAMVFLGIFGRIDRSTLVWANAGLWLFVAVKNRKIFSHPFKLPALSLPPMDQKWRLILFAPFLATSLLMLLSSLVPPTKADEVAYHLFYTKLSVLEGGFRFHYSPFYMLTYMGMQTYNIWPYTLGAEYAPALNSVFCYLLASFLLFFWALDRFGPTVAFSALLVTACSLAKVVDGIAPGDSTATYLMLMALVMLGYDIWKEAEERGPFPLDSETKVKLFALNLVSALSIVVKLTNLVWVIPYLLLFYASLFLFRKVRIEPRFFPILVLPFLVLIPFFLRAYKLYGNPLFPLASDLFGAGPFNPDALVEHIHAAARAQITGFWGVFDLTRKYFIRYFTNYDSLGRIHLLFWVSSLFGVFRLVKEKAFYIVLPGMIAYTVAAYKLPADFFRYYLGVIDFLAVLGLAEFLSWFPRRTKAFSKTFVSTLVLVTASFVTLASAIYTKQFVFYLLTNQDRDSFIKPRVECYETIQWINRHLPENSFALVETRGRYYYNRKIEALEPTVLGHPKEVLNDFERFYHLLEQNGVTHLMTREFLGQAPREDPYFRFCQTEKYAEKIYENDHEIVVGQRWRAPLFGRAQVYRLK